MTDNDLISKRVALNIARGNRSLSEFDLIFLGIQAEVFLFKPEFLPGPKTVSGTPKERKAEIFRLAEAIWGIKPDGWLLLENLWLQNARSKSGSTETGGKDELDDVVSAEILIRLIGAAKLMLTVHNTGELLHREAVNAVNITIQEAVVKGRTRISRYGDKTVYSMLKDVGIMIGAGGGKYLPDPETSLPALFLLLHREKISSNVYK